MGGVDPDSLAARRDRVIARLRKIRVWLLLIVGGVAVGLLPWTAYLSASLPSQHLANHWDIAWAGLDLFEATALVALFVRPEARPVAELDRQRERGQRRDAAQAAEPADRLRKRRLRGELGAQPALPTTARRRGFGFGSCPSAHIAARPTRGRPRARS